MIRIIPMINYLMINILEEQIENLINKLENKAANRILLQGILKCLINLKTRQKTEYNYVISLSQEHNCLIDNLWIAYS